MALSPEDRLCLARAVADVRRERGVDDAVALHLLTNNDPGVFQLVAATAGDAAPVDHVLEVRELAEQRLNEIRGIDTPARFIDVFHNPNRFDLAVRAVALAEGLGYVEAATKLTELHEQASAFLDREEAEALTLQAVLAKGRIRLDEAFGHVEQAYADSVIALSATVSTPPPARTPDSHGYVMFGPDDDVAALLTEPVHAVRAWLRAKELGLTTQSSEEFGKDWRQYAEMGIDHLGTLQAARHEEEVRRAAPAAAGKRFAKAEAEKAMTLDRAARAASDLAERTEAEASRFRGGRLV